MRLRDILDGSKAMSFPLASPAASGADMRLWQQERHLILNDEERILADPGEFHIAGIH